jgi:hypothetical protein
MSLESDGGMILTGENRRTRRKTCPSATLFTINPTWIDPGANPDLRGKRPATNDLSHGTALFYPLTVTFPKLAVILRPLYTIEINAREVVFTQNRRLI